MSDITLRRSIACLLGLSMFSACDGSMTVLDASVGVDGSMDGSPGSDGGRPVDSSVALDGSPTPDMGTFPLDCLHPAPGWNRLETAEIFHGSPYLSTGVHDVTTFESIWGRDYSNAADGYPVIALWPGLDRQMVIPRIGANAYVAARFHTPDSTSTPGHTFKVDPTSYGLSGGDGISNTARISLTVSTVCGDFDTASPYMPFGCSFNLEGSNQEMPIFVTDVGPACRLQPNTDYYLNIIYAPLTSPASAVFNGFGSLGLEATLLQNGTVVNP